MCVRGDSIRFYDNYHLQWISANPGSYIPLPLTKQNIWVRKVSPKYLGNFGNVEGPVVQVFILWSTSHGYRRYRPSIVLLPAACDAQSPPEREIKGNDHYLYIFTWYVGTESKKMNITMQYAFETIQPDWVKTFHRSISHDFIGDFGSSSHMFMTVRGVS